MMHRGPAPRGREEILRAIRQVRNRWRLRRAVRGGVVVLAGGLAAFLLSSWGLEYFRFSPESVQAFRIGVWVLLALLVARWVAWPLMRRVSDEQVALYLEEEEPSLEAALVSALEAPEAESPASSALVRGLVASAVEKCRAIDYGRRVGREELKRSSGVLAGVGALSAALVLFGPVELRNGAAALFLPGRDAEAVNPYAITVEPGDVTIPRGSDQPIRARLSGFESPDVDVHVRGASEQGFRRISMLPEEEGGFEILLLGVGETTEYFVESTGIRSGTHTIEVADLPYVDHMELVYHFPAYTGLEPRVVEDGGDVAALRGTEVRLRVHPTLATPGGQLVVEGEGPVTLQRAEDGSWTGSFRVDGDGFYAIELQRADGRLVEASPRYTIDALEDQPPTVSFEEPGRDTQVSPIEEVFVETRADDDFGVGDVRVVYSVNGGPADSVTVFRAEGRAMPEVSAGHTFFLEEWELEPGDVVSYWAVARDNRTGGQSVTSDIYFLNVRPFRRDFRQAEQQGGGAPMGGGAAGPETGLSELQRQVVAATFNLIRDEGAYAEAQYAENLVSVNLAQSRVREQVETLHQRMVNRGILETDPEFRRIADLLPLAVEEMKAAEERLEAKEPVEALGPEQRALRQLQKAEETYERYVTEQSGGGGGGSGSAANAEDLADLFELELDKLKNQYETVQRGQQRQMDDEVDETLERLEELAQRQQQEAERQRRRAASQQGSSGGGGGDSQRALAEETEEAVRQLERLARENQDPEMMETARDLQEAAEAMRRSAASAGNAGTAAAEQARERLEEARRRLEQSRSDRLDRDADSARRTAAQLAEAQERIREEVAGLPASGPEREERLRRLMERKDAMAEDVEALEQQLDRIAANALREQREAARGFQGAADGIRDDKIKEKVRFSKGVVQARDRETAARFEEEIAGDLETLRERIDAAAGAIEESDDERLSEALERTQDLVRDMETAERRLDQQSRARGPAEGDREPGQPGDPSGGAPEGEAEGEATGPPSGEAGSQAGQQSGEGAEGREAREGAGGARPDAGPVTTGGPGGDRRGAFTPEDVRQFRREFSERRQEVGDLRRMLTEEGRDPEALDAVLRALQQLEDERTWGNPLEVARLQQEILEGLKNFEFDLRREIEGEERDRAFLSGSDEVPPAFRKLVEEYYRSLSRSPEEGNR